jgi:hypothetical protein
MKKYLFLLTILLLISCSVHKTTNAQQNFNKEKGIVTSNNDTINVKQDSVNIEFYTKNFYSENQKFLNKKHERNIAYAIESIRLSPETFKMIEEDGGMANVLKNILSKENYNKIENVFTVNVYVMLSLGDLTISEYNIQVYKKNSPDFWLSNAEIEKLFEYCKKMRFIYMGIDFKDETVPAGYFFPIKKMRNSE